MTNAPGAGAPGPTALGRYRRAVELSSPAWAARSPGPSALVHSTRAADGLRQPTGYTAYLIGAKSAG